MKIAITGRPGSGKTTLCKRIFDSIKDEFDCGGFITKERREKGIRVGFLFHDLVTGEEFWLASVKSDSRIRVGKYGVILDNIEKISDRIKEYAKKEVLIIDEIGPMELKSRKFVEEVERVLHRDGTNIFTIHYRSNHSLIQKVRKSYQVFVIDEHNRDMVFEEIVSEFR
ncbi:putative nucleotide kinase [Archaeoglobus sulfaticallidus PM70-1]|uniref:Nucleoside-triphosphatase Asulf_01285 n=1 Tax=Archaeoglobus sulfaticallidus PM70-1 TaxID=387631 RepID=N0BCD6_9EURY|nr:NTPase [Archaeoglobus sulfaticallidus]AGK61279.1 putative nucleotide kinase [Archaeoglobus sulfaticallidus PM70-1]